MKDRFRFRVWQTELQVPKMKYNSGIGFIKNQLDDTDCVIMQCTGLKDKNGTLIYEGDILKDKYGSLHSISWNIKGFYEADTFAVAGFYNAIQEDMEVIGNIYENKELLNG